MFKKLLEKPRTIDAVILSIFTILITWQPYFIHGKINIFEVGLYLPGIQSVLDGGVPYRDVFHLRGPLELYMPAFLMKIFGMHLQVLYSYFYFGSILCLILCVFIGKEILKTRYLLYLMTPVVIARAFPRVVYAYWGGMRYAFGLMAILCIIKFFKTERKLWIFLAGISSALGLLTSVEMGIYPFLGLGVAFAAALLFKIQKPKFIFKSAALYLGGMFTLIIPCFLYLFSQQALGLFLDSVYTIVTNMQNVIDPHLVSVYPRNFPEAFVAMINPNHTNFKHMTPSYLYIFILSYLIYRIGKKQLNKMDLSILCLGIYGFIMYNTGFRGIWAAQFEMALQPEKILLFFLIEIFFLGLLARKLQILEFIKSHNIKEWSHPKRWKVYFINFCLLGLFGSSIGYSIARYNHRYVAFKIVRDKLAGKDISSLRPLANEKSRALNIERARGIEVPIEQADELEEVEAFIHKNVSKQDSLLMFPEMGTYHFLFDRPFVGRFPITTMTWFNEKWQKEFMQDLKKSPPKYIFFEKNISQGWKDVYLGLEPNRKKFQEVVDFIQANYILSDETTLSYIYKQKESIVRGK